MCNAKSLMPIVCLLGLLTSCSTPAPVHGEGAGFEQPNPEPPIYQIEKREVRPVEGISDCDFASPETGLRVVYFDFDSYVIREDGRTIVQDHAARGIKDQRKILILGNTDERGGSEYNLALGQKRAEAVRKAMAALGVTEDQMETVSLGKEKPADDGHDEEAWARNRNAVIVHKAK